MYRDNNMRGTLSAIKMGSEHYRTYDHDCIPSFLAIESVDSSENSGGKGLLMLYKTYSRELFVPIKSA